MTIHRDTPPPVLEGVTYTAVQTNDREYIDRLDRKGETVYIWKDKRNRTWVAVRDSGEVICPRCNGTGKYQRLGFSQTDCAVCDGLGKLPNA